MPDVTVVGTPTSSGNSTNSTSRATAIPSGTQAGDYSVCVLDRWFGSNTNPAVTLSGFTVIDFGSSSDNAAKITAFYKKLTAPEAPGNYTASWTGSAFAVLRCIVLRNVIGTGDPLVAAMQKVSGSFGAVTSMVFSANAGDALIWAMYNDSAATHTAPTTFTKDIDVDCSALAHKIATTTGTQTASGGSASVSSPAAAIFFGFKRQPDSSNDATLTGTLPSPTGSIPASGRSNAALAGSLPGPSAAFAAQAVDAGTLAGSLLSPVVALAGALVNDGTLAGALPGLAAAFAGAAEAAGTLAGAVTTPTGALVAEATGSGLLAAGLPMPLATWAATGVAAGDLVGVVAPVVGSFTAVVDTEDTLLVGVLSLPTVALMGTVSAPAVVSGVLPTAVGGVFAVVIGEGVIAGVLPGPSADFTGLVQVPGAGTINVILPAMISITGMVGRVNELEKQRRFTRNFIAANPTEVVLIPSGEVRTPSGGVIMQDSVPRHVQRVRLIPMSHTERPQESVSPGGVQRKYDMTILGEWDAVIRENDYWFVGEQKYVVEALVSDNEYEVKGLVMSYGRSPRHG
jgi:hypothetical protein